jgi:phage antirepressor YoqD-like protein
LTITVKDFAKTLKISDKALIERMQKAGLSHSRGSDEVTASDKQALLKFLKGAKTQSKSINLHHQQQLKKVIRTILKQKELLHLSS